MQGGGRQPVGLDRSGVLERPGVTVQTLILLRWTAIVGQLATLLIVGLGFGFPIPWGPALAAVGTSVLINLGLKLLYRRGDRLDGRSALVHLLYDVVQISVLLFLTGGLSNPFALMLLVPINISATLLSGRATALMVAATLALLFALWRWHLPLPWLGPPLELPDPYRLARLVAIGAGMVFLSIFSWRVAAESRRRQAALVATQAALDRETRMGALGSLAAAAAHELGGPLGTIALIAHDLEDQLERHPDLASDVQLLNHEVRRCRDILSGISERAEADDPFPVLPLGAILREVLEPFEPTRVPVQLFMEWPPGMGPVVRRSPEILHGLSNIISNALRHAKSQVRVVAGEDGERFLVAIIDDGAGFPPELLPKLGEPFLGPSFSGSGSTGLGIFIATTLLERTGGRLQFSNLPRGGARVELRWWRADLEAAGTSAGF